MDDGKRKERDEGLRSLIDKYNDMVANSLLGPNEKREIVDRCYEMRERFGFVPGSLGDYFIVRIANVLAQDVGLRLNIQDIRRPKSLITCSQFLALSSNFHAAALHFEKEQTENTLKDLLRAARELRKGIVSSEDEVIWKRSD